MSFSFLWFAAVKKLMPWRNHGGMKRHAVELIGVSIEKTNTLQWNTNMLVYTVATLKITLLANDYVYRYR